MKIDPVIFSDGSDFYQNLSKKYKLHPQGLFILAPSGAGKTYYCARQTEPNWLDGDDLWIESKAQPAPPLKWWEMGVDVINRIEQRCDVITSQAVDRGFWVLGSVNFWYQPSAVVIPPFDVLKKQIIQRQSSNYDGGLTEDHFDQLNVHIEIIKKWHTDFGVPMFSSIQDAINSLTL